MSLTYPGSPPVQALRAVSLTVQAGEMLAVIGPSGSGKSTFLNVVGLLDRPTDGSYRLEGRNTGALSETDRTALRGQKIGFVFQAFHLMAHRSATENVELALLYNRSPRATRSPLARAALKRVGLDHRLDALPSTMSGGERQRVAIARATVSRPALLLCDEPTGNLDTTTAASVLDLLQELNNSGLTVVVITHDPGVAARADRYVSITDGVLVDHAPATGPG